jgi:hypothetical protein
MFRRSTSLHFLRREAANLLLRSRGRNDQDRGSQTQSARSNRKRRQVGSTGVRNATGHTRAIFNTPSQASRRCFHRRPFACGNRPESVPRVYQEWASRGTFSFRKPDRYAMTQIAFWILEISANQHSCVRANYEPSRRRDLSFDNRFPNVFFRFLYATARTVACRYGSSE